MAFEVPPQADIYNYVGYSSCISYAKGTFAQQADGNQWLGIATDAYGNQYASYFSPTCGNLCDGVATCSPSCAGVCSYGCRAVSGGPAALVIPGTTANPAPLWWTTLAGKGRFINYIRSVCFGVDIDTCFGWIRKYYDYGYSVVGKMSDWSELTDIRRYTK
jgi:hypothetical protein